MNFFLENDIWKNKTGIMQLKQENLLNIQFGSI